MDLAIDKNMIDKDEYPQTAELERRCVHMLADLWNAPASENPVGASAIGSSEACMLGGMAAKWRWRARRQAAGLSTDRPNMVCGPVQVVWHKFAKYWDIEMREVPMSAGHYAMDVDDMLARVDENTIMVVPTFGVHVHGRVRDGQAAGGRARRAAGRERAGHRHPRRRGQRRVPRPVLRTAPRMGLPPATGQVDQHVGAQVRPGAARRRMDRVARRRRAPRRPDLPRVLPRWRHARVPDQLLPSRRADRRAVLRLRPPRPRGLPPRAHVGVRHRAVPRREDRRARSVRDDLRQRPEHGHPVRRLADRRGRRRAVHVVRTSPTVCASAVGRCRRTR